MKSLVCLFISLSLATKVTISNVEPRKDNNGEILNAHSGGVYRFNQKFYMYGTKYSDCFQLNATCNTVCGYYNNTFRVYSSDDLMNWKLENSNLAPWIEKDNAYVEYDEVNVGFNKETNLYYLFYWNGNNGFHNSNVSVAISSSPIGPFNAIDDVQMKGGVTISSSTFLFVDDDGEAYISYNTRDEPLRHVIEKLSKDWKSSTGSYSTILNAENLFWYEGGATWKQGEKYFTTTGTDCCYCTWGGDVLILSATNPLGPWTKMESPAKSELNLCADGNFPSYAEKDGTINPCSEQNQFKTNFTIPSQQFNTISVSTTDGLLSIYFGERWSSGKEFGLPKSQDFQAWIPFKFNEESKSFSPLEWVDSFEFTLYYPEEEDNVITAMY